MEENLAVMMTHTVIRTHKPNSHMVKRVVLPPASNHKCPQQVMVQLTRMPRGVAIKTTLRCGMPACKDKASTPKVKVHQVSRDRRVRCDSSFRRHAVMTCPL